MHYAAIVVSLVVSTSKSHGDSFHGTTRRPDAHRTKHTKNDGGFAQKPPGVMRQQTTKGTSMLVLRTNNRSITHPNTTPACPTPRNAEISKAKDLELMLISSRFAKHSNGFTQKFCERNNRATHRQRRQQSTRQVVGDPINGNGEANNELKTAGNIEFVPFVSFSWPGPAGGRIVLANSHTPRKRGHRRVDRPIHLFLGNQGAGHIDQGMLYQFVPPHVMSGSVVSSSMLDRGPTELCRV